VPAAFLVAQVGADVVGRVSIRFELNDFLRAQGGHVGYGVRPAFRRRGYANEILRQSLVVARAEGVDRVLVTCEEGNEGSVGVIRRHGGLEEAPHVDRSGTVWRRFWLD
jgi:predicted acetyltransferase